MPAYNDIQSLNTWLNRQIVGQEHLVERMLMSLLADGHLLVEGAPGLAKTKAIKTLAQAIEGRFHRIQFTPDLLPSDVTGTDIYRPEEGRFEFQPGPKLESTFFGSVDVRSEEHTSELQSRGHLVCRLLLE